MNVHGNKHAVNSYGDSSDDTPDSNPQPQSAAGDMNNLFMTLLVAQIQNQDPLNPTNGTEYVSQLAQLSQVQSMENMSSLMQNNSVLMDNLQTLTTANLVGQKVMVQTDSFTSDGTPIDGRITLQDPAATVTVHVKGEDGVDHTIELGKQDAGQADFSIDPKSLGLEDGKYSISVETDTGETKIPVEVAGVVNNVRIPLDGSVTMLNISGLGDIPYNQISQFGPSQPDNTPINKPL